MGPDCDLEGRPGLPTLFIQLCFEAGHRHGALDTGDGKALLSPLLSSAVRQNNVEHATAAGDWKYRRRLVKKGTVRR